MPDLSGRDANCWASRVRSVTRLVEALRNYQRLSALGVYLALAALLFARPVAPYYTTAYLGWGVDQTFFIWCLAWWPYALYHHLNPMVSKFVFSPLGLNLAWTKPVPLVSLLALPLTKTMGPVAAYNLLCVISPALAAWSAFLLCRYLTAAAFWASLLGGCLFGFSPYLIGHLVGGHLDCFLVFLVPLMVWLVIARLDGRATRRSFGLPFTTLLVAQFLIADEIVATMTVFGMIALALGWMLGDRGLRRRINGLALPIGLAYLTTAAIVSPWLYYIFADFNRSPMRSIRKNSADLLSLVIPPETVQFGDQLPLFHRLAGNFTSGIAENGGYIGLPLLVITAWFAVTCRRTLSGRMIALMLAITVIMAMGPRLHVDGVSIVPLPWNLARHLPLLGQALPIRFSLYTSLLLAIAAAKWFSAAHLPSKVRLVAAALVLASLLPNTSAQFWSKSAKTMATPPFFSQGLYRHYLVEGETIVVPPSDWGAGSESMMWQAETGMYFRIATGYLPFAPKAIFEWPVVKASLRDGVFANQAVQWLPFLAAHNVDAVVLPDNRHYRGVEQMLAGLGVSPQKIGGVALYRIPPAMLAPYHRAAVRNTEGSN